MPEEKDLEKEITDAAYNGAKEALNELEMPENPDIQRVEVTNFPEQKAPIVNVPKPEVTVNVPPARVNVEAPIVEVSAPDLSAIADMMQKQADSMRQLVEKEAPEFNYKEFERIAKENKSTYQGGAVGPSKVFSTIRATNNSSTTQTAYEIAQGTFPGWEAQAKGATVIFTANSNGNKSGSFSLAQTGAATPAAGSDAETLAGVASTDTDIVYTTSVTQSGDFRYAFSDREITLQPGETITLAVKSLTATADCSGAANAREDQ